MKKEARNKARARAEAMDKIKKQLREGNITKAQMKNKAKQTGRVRARA